jgi:DNA polymerase epsilon subunit 4
MAVARTKKIIAADDDIHSCSNNAAFVITIATEMFIQHLVKQSYEIKSDKRQRKNLAYSDLGTMSNRVRN